ncbi:MAG: hypothetical protein ACK5E6_00665 [Cyanobacteriota bacterium]
MPRPGRRPAGIPSPRSAITATFLLVSLAIRQSAVNNSLGVLDGPLNCWWAS